MKTLLLITALLFSLIATSQDYYKESFSLSAKQKEVVTAMGSGDKLYKTTIGYQLVCQYRPNYVRPTGWKEYSSRWIHSATFKSLKRRKIIEPKDKNPKNKGYGEYILTEKGEEINHNLTT